MMLTKLALLLLLLQMTTEQTQDYCKRKTTYVQKQQQAVQKVRGGAALAASACACVEKRHRPVIGVNQDCCPTPAPTCPAGCSGAQEPADAGDRRAAEQNGSHAVRRARQQRSGGQVDSRRARVLLPEHPAMCWCDGSRRLCSNL
jgi:hypothetical protein